MSAATRHRDAVIANLERGQIRKTRSTDYTKREQRDFQMFQKGVLLGAQLEKARILNATAGLTYEDTPTVDGAGKLAGDPGVSDSVTSGFASVGDPIPANSESESLP